MKDFINEHNPKDFLDVDEFIALRKAALAEFRAANGLETEAPVPKDAADEPPGDDAPPGDAEEAANAVQVCLLSFVTTVVRRSRGIEI